MPPPRPDEPIDLLFWVVERRGGAGAALAHGDLGAALEAKLLDELLVVMSRRGKADDAAPLPQPARAEDAVALRLQAADQAVGQQLHAVHDRIGIERAERLERRLQPQQ